MRIFFCSPKALLSVITGSKQIQIFEQPKMTLSNRRMKTYHLLYTLPDGSFVNEEKEFGSFGKAEAWLVSIGATDWEIGVPPTGENDEARK